MAYIPKYDAQGNVIGLSLSNPADGGFSSRGGDIPLPEQFELVKIHSNPLQLGFRVGNSVNIIEGPAAQKVLESFGTTADKIRSFTTTDFLSSGFLTRNEVGPSDAQASTMSAEQKMQAATQYANQFTSMIKQNVQQPKIGSGSTAVTYDGTVSTAAGAQTSYVYGADVLDKKANNSAVNHLYKQYFGRDATAAELANWGEKGGADTTVRALEDFLKAEQVKYGVQPGASQGAPATAGTSPTGATNGSGVDLNKPVTGVAFKETDAYKALPQEMKDFVDIAYNLIEVGGEAEATMFSNAIKQAKAIADPYYRTQLSLASAEVLGAIAENTNDLETRKEIITRARDELLEDVSASKEFLSLEQQAEIARQAREYDEDLLNIADQAAEKGITFATGARSRVEAERRRGEEYTDVIQSTNRKANFQTRELELKARRGDTDAQKSLEALQRESTLGLQKIGRSAEEVLGTGNLPPIAGFTPVGGVAGKIEEEKQKTTLSDVAGFVELQKGFI